MSVLDEPETSGGLRFVALWCWILLEFVAASGLQVLIYGAPHVWPHLPEVIQLPEALYFAFIPIVFFGPSLTAAVCAVWALRRFYHRETDTCPPTSAMVLVVLLSLVSCYLGVFVAFNTWGT